MDLVKNASNKRIIQEIKDYAQKNSVPIMTDDGIDYVQKYIKQNNILKILEIGTAIGYSAIMMCEISPSITVTESGVAFS